MVFFFFFEKLRLSLGLINGIPEMLEISRTPSVMLAVGAVRDVGVGLSDFLLIIIK